MQGIKARCKQCGKQWDADDFVLDPVYKQMVCRPCSKQRQKGALQGKERKREIEKERVKQLEKEKVLKIEEPAVRKPAGWDADDEYIEQLARIKKQSQGPTVEVKRLDKERVRYKCPKCKFVFNYNFVKKSPTSCVYCGCRIFKIVEA